MEKLIILLLFGIGSAFVNWIQKKQQKEAERRDRETDQAAPVRATGPRAARPVAQNWPQNPTQWAEELRRLLDPNAQPPPPVPTVRQNPPGPKMPPVITRQRAPQPTPIPAERTEGDVVMQSPLKQSTTAYERAASLQQKVEARMKTIDEQTEKHFKRAVVVRRKTRTAAELAQGWRKNPQSVREALLASIILGKPQGLQELPT